MQTSQTFFKVRDYALGETLRSGQAFRWREVNGTWEGVVGRHWLQLQPSSEGIEAKTSEKISDWTWLRDYLQVDTDLAEVIASFPDDIHMAKSVQECRGLRLLKQDPWECLASFILSSTKQIVQIQQIIALLCERFGEEIIVPAPHESAFSFPSAAKLAALSENDLRSCKMGFRAPYLRQTAQAVAARDIKLEAIGALPVEQARAQLMRLPGVGRKIADCVLLFAYRFQEAFPLDVWILKALRQLYFPRRRPTPKRLLAFTETYFGPHAGYAQQYLFHYMRTRVGREKK